MPRIAYNNFTGGEISGAFYSYEALNIATSTGASSNAKRVDFSLTKVSHVYQDGLTTV